jgi:hypothetical protein
MLQGSIIDDSLTTAVTQKNEPSLSASADSVTTTTAINSPSSMDIYKQRQQRKSISTKPL